MRRPLGLRAGREGLEAAPARAVQDRFGEDRAGGVSGAEEQRAVGGVVGGVGLGHPTFSSSSRPPQSISSSSAGQRSGRLPQQSSIRKASNRRMPASSAR